MEEILQLLKDNARLSAEDIAAMTKKTVAEVNQIIKKFEDEGVILKYSAILNPDKVADTKEKVRAIIMFLIPRLIPFLMTIRNKRFFKE